jgi:nitroimidazol reductase NimA-like FMN-containing flavoprotein (pyridoxamine 5'-phosphate oxidase superfamily)
VTEQGDVDRAIWALRAYDTLALATISAAGPHVAGVYFAPEAGERGVQLIIVTLRDSRLQREMAADPRVAFLCSPGNASRWIQGTGAAAFVSDDDQSESVLARLTAHAPGATQFVESAAVQPAIITVDALKIVEASDRAPLLLTFATP